MGKNLKKRQKAGWKYGRTNVLSDIPVGCRGSRFLLESPQSSNCTPSSIFEHGQCKPKNWWEVTACWASSTMSTGSRKSSSVWSYTACHIGGAIGRTRVRPKLRQKQPRTEQVEAGIRGQGSVSQQKRGSLSQFGSRTVSGHLASKRVTWPIQGFGA